MSNKQAANWSDNHLGPKDEFALEAWNQGEIYRGEQYLEFFNGDIVLDSKEELLEYISDNWDDFYETILGNADKRTAK